MRILPTGFLLTGGPQSTFRASTGTASVAGFVLRIDNE
jgi:hypothetical protein